jgi:outer membrane protein assembly factor BamB
VEDRVYVASMDHNVYCLDAETGVKIWQIEVGGAVAAQPILDATSGILYVGAFDGRVYAIDVSSDSPALVEGFDFQAGNWIWSEVLVHDGQLYVTSLDGRLYALDATSGAVLPPYPYNSSEEGQEGDRIRAAPVQAEDLIVVAAESGRVVGVQNAARQWVWPTGGVPESSVLATPTVSEGIVYVALKDGQVQALNAADGGQKWRFTPPEAQ